MNYEYNPASLGAPDGLMEIVHRISFHSSEVKAIAEFGQLNIGLEVDGPLAQLIVNEAHPSWPAVRGIVLRHEVVDLVSTTFAARECLQADFLSIDGNWHNGYPQPEDDYEEVSYDLGNYCASCGSGKVQNAPLRIKSEPKWGRRSIMQLNWIFDEFFTKPEVWEAVFRPFGIGSRPVCNKSGEKEFETVVQLVFEGNSSLNTTGLAYETCLLCGRRKYLPNARGFIPRPLDPPGQAFKSVEDFGSGGSSYKEVFISQQLYRAITEAKLLGAVYSPCAQP